MQVYCMTTSKDIRECVGIFRLKGFLPKFNEAPQCTFGDNVRQHGPMFN